MPPKCKYTRQQILDAAVQMTREAGIDSVTARDLGSRLGVSSRPIFCAFENMDDLKNNIRSEAKALFDSYLSDYREYTPSFKRYGMQLVSFAREEPRLFELLFMREDKDGHTFSDAIYSVMGSLDQILTYLEEQFRLTREQATKLYNHLWIKTYGICVLCVQKVCSFSDEEIGVLLSETFLGTLNLIRSEPLQNAVKTAVVRKKADPADGQSEQIPFEIL